MYQCVAAHSELLCYFIIILNHMVTASAASLVLPVLVFLWAMLSIPRPSKRFWMTAIVFTEVGSNGRVGGGRGGPGPAMLSPSSLQVTVVTKYLFQFGFFPWNSHTVLRRNENKPYFPPRILGLEKTDSYIKYDLVQLMALFFHRSQLLVSGRQWAGTSQHLPTTPSLSRFVLGGEAGHCGPWGRPGHLACPALELPSEAMPASSLPSLSRFLHSAMASGTMKKTHFPRSMMGAVKRRRSLRRSRPCWNSRPRQTQGLRRSQGWPELPLRMIARWK